MPFPVGATVVALSLGRTRGTVVHAGRAGRYRVQVESLTMTCGEEDLAAPDINRRTSKLKTDRRELEQIPTPEPARPGRVDLHGLTVEDAVAQVTREIDEALRRGADRVEVVHGKGSGRVRDGVHRHLASLPVVAAFRLDPRNPGVTWVWFAD